MSDDDTHRAKMTVEVPVHVKIEFDEPMPINRDENAELDHMTAIDIVEKKVPTEEFEQAVRDELESDTVSVKDVFAANSYECHIDPDT